jgi:phenylalanyl-tRNA synthetase alpha chain
VTDGDAGVLPRRRFASGISPASRSTYLSPSTIHHSPPFGMTLKEFLAALDELTSDGPARIAEAASLDAWTEVRNALVGRQSGRLTEILGGLSDLPKEDRKEAGQRANAVKVALEAALEARRAELAASTATSGPALDLSMPGRSRWHGAVHPVSLVIDEVVEIFRELGFTVALGPEAEHAWYNFGALNFPADHPAMDLHDTLYLGEERVLRTHTSPVQVRTLQQYPPPIRILAPGNVYRRDFFDPSHAPMFAQIEGMVVDEGVTFADLKATLTHFARRFFGPTTKTRFRPSYFPFTEPSAEMDVQCGVCGGSGCAVCKQSGWIEILGSGMMHPAVLENAGLDSERYTGWAFGMGPARTALSRHGIPDIRILYDADVRFLEQFVR